MGACVWVCGRVCVCVYVCVRACVFAWVLGGEGGEWGHGICNSLREKAVAILGTPLIHDPPRARSRVFLVSSNPARECYTPQDL